MCLLNWSWGGGLHGGARMDDPACLLKRERNTRSFLGLRGHMFQYHTLETIFLWTRMNNIASPTCSNLGMTRMCLKGMELQVNLQRAAVTNVHRFELDLRVQIVSARQFFTFDLWWYSLVFWAPLALSSPGSMAMDDIGESILLIGLLDRP